MPAIEGVWAAAVTPRRQDHLDIDLAGMWEMLDFLGSKKLNGIVLMGSTGEFVHFSVEERTRMMTVSVKRSRVPLLINVSHSTLDGAVHLAEAAMDAGAAGLLLMPPYFFRYGAEALRAFFLKFLDLARPRIPALLYNIPIFTSPIPAELTAELLREGAYEGIKDSSGDWGSFERLRALRQPRPFTLMLGADQMFTRAQPLGLSGVISGVACAVPEMMLGLAEALNRNQAELVTRLEHRLSEFLLWFDQFPVPMLIKEGAALRGVKVGVHATLVSDDQNRKLAEFREWFRGWLPQVQRESSL